MFFCCNNRTSSWTICGNFASRDRIETWERSKTIRFGPLKAIVLSSLQSCTWRQLERKCKQGGMCGSGAVKSYWHHPAATSENLLDLKLVVSLGVHSKWTSHRGIYLTSKRKHKQIFYCYRVSVFGFHHSSLEQLDPGNRIKYKMEAWGTGSNAKWNSVMFKIISFVCF